MKLSVWARKEGIGYRAAWRMWKAGQLKAHQLPTGTIIVEEERPSILPDSVAIYVRVSSSEKRGNLDSQAERLTQYAIARGYRIYRVVKEVGSGVNDSRKQLLKLLTDDGYSKTVVEHRDRLTRFGFNYIDTLLRQHGKWDRRSRSGTVFRCVHCGHTDDADMNGVQNIRLLGLAGVYSLRSLPNEFTGRNICL